MLIRPFAAIAFMLCIPAPGLAQTCGGPDAPCALENGTYNLSYPDTSDPVGIVMHLHGGGGSGAGMMNSGLATEALSRGYVFVAPSGEHPENEWTNDWSVRADNMSFERDDVQFLLDVKADVQAQTGLDGVPFLLAGFSRGGSMTWEMACLTPDFADAYAPLAGAFWEDLPQDCAGPVALFHTHGWTDRTVPLEGRTFFDGTVVQGDVWASLKLMRQVNGCSARQPESSSFDGDLWFRHWTDCEGADIELLLHQGGHGAPDGWPQLVMDWFETVTD